MCGITNREAVKAVFQPSMYRALGAKYNLRRGFQAFKEIVGIGGFSKTPAAMKRRLDWSFG